MLAWRAATIIMVIVTAVTLAFRLLGLGPFTDVFDLFIVYLPTAILVGRVVYRRSEGSSARAEYVMSDQLTPENKAV